MGFSTLPNIFSRPDFTKVCEITVVILQIGSYESVISWHCHEKLRASWFQTNDIEGMDCPTIIRGGGRHLVQRMVSKDVLLSLALLTASLFSGCGTETSVPEAEDQIAPTNANPGERAFTNAVAAPEIPAFVDN